MECISGIKRDARRWRQREPAGFGGRENIVPEAIRSASGERASERVDECARQLRERRTT